MIVQQLNFGISISIECYLVLLYFVKQHIITIILSNFTQTNSVAKNNHGIKFGFEFQYSFLFVI